MQTKFKDGSVMAVGNCARDAELARVGANGKRVCKVGLAVGKRTPEEGGDPETVWANVVAWENLAEVLAAAKKGDPVCVIGRLKSREYNGKTYTDLVADWLSVCAWRAAPPEKDFAELPDDGELPF